MRKALYIALVGVLAALLVYATVIPQAAGWGGGGCKPRPRPQPKPKEAQPKPDPLPPAPEKTEWKDTKGLSLSKEEIAEKDLFGHFADMKDIGGTKPVLVYFYWPKEDADSDNEEIANQVRRCKLMDEILATEELRSASALFHSYRCSIKDVSDDLKTEYKLTLVPKIIFFDVKGRKVWRLTSTKAKPDGIARKMAQIAADSKLLLKSMKK